MPRLGYDHINTNQLRLAQSRLDMVLEFPEDAGKMNGAEAIRG